MSYDGKHLPMQGKVGGGPYTYLPFQPVSGWSSPGRFLIRMDGRLRISYSRYKHETGITR